ncbi:MAG: DUF4926 domain-containing protein [Chitinophagales bacterium]|nr:DUF4926 domain-containing protein [Chitinophagales bacterium]
MIPEFSQVILAVDLPDKLLQKGDVGVVVQSFEEGNGYAVEFFKLDGSTFTEATVSANQILIAGKNHLLHVRELV